MIADGMQQIQNYTVAGSRLQRAVRYGVTVKQDRAVLEEGEAHFLILPGFNSFQKKRRWGRFHLRAAIPMESRLKIYAFARDAETDEEMRRVAELNAYFAREDISLEEKRDVFLRADGICEVDKEDLLFYELEGQYLWVAIEVTGNGAGALWDMKLFNPGDNFMQTFPEIYQDVGGFFHRYMSVFSSIYADIQGEIEQAAQFLNPDTTPASMLPVLADWLGIQAEEGYLDEKVLRKLLREGYQLNRIKGTRACIVRLAQIVFGEDVQIIERNLLRASESGTKVYRKLYGDTPWDVTILSNKVPQERLQEQFLYLLAQYKPVRCKVHLAFQRNCGTLDSYSYMDGNARLMQARGGSLEQDDLMDDGVVLK